ncbi:MAG: proline--tRNA ligase [Desulfohalobiaceae bacterium]|nr:proline--tRNA ligase [Desulfohalobiaceae bacterium]
MRLSKYYFPTLKENPAEAEVVSHRLLVRAGMIRKLTSGIYTYLPLGLKSIDKTANIIREELNRAGCLEVLMPMVQPADLWKETGRWEEYGKELLRLQDRHLRDSCLGPTHEEVITDLIRRDVHSYRQLPVNLYQVQTKFRDEIRPRFGLMRCREFIMKDGYSFDRDEAGAERTYMQMFEAYTRIFQRLGLDFRSVQADSGAIGGSFSHEFMVLAETGEDTIAVCSSCTFAANLEKAKVTDPRPTCRETCAEAEPVKTPDMHTVQKVADFLDVAPRKIVKTMLYEADGRAVAALVPGDRELNEVKLKNYLNAVELKLASSEQVVAWTRAKVGFAGPKDLDVQTIVADTLLSKETDWITGANQDEYHLRHVDLKRDVRLAGFADLVNIRESDPCPDCGAAVTFYKGIEVGHIFKLGAKYSRSMQATFLDEKGEEKEIIMGCYGIGVGRLVAAAIEQNHDENGILFPPSIAPFETVLIALNAQDRKVMATAEECYGLLRNRGIDVLFDDRDERPGFKFKDADLAGYPLQIIVGGKGLEKGVAEVKDRRTGERGELPLDDFAASFDSWRQNVWQGWGLGGD